MRVLWLIKGLGPGGAERLLFSASRAHGREEFEFEVAYLLPWKDALVRELEEAGVVVHCLEASTPLDPRWVPRLLRLVRDGGFDIVHHHSPLVGSIARAALRASGSKRPRVVSTQHNVWRSYTRATYVLNALTFPLDDAQIAVSADVSDSIPRLLRRRVVTVVHGIPVEDAQAAGVHRGDVRSELGISPETIVIGTVANLRAQKDYPNLLSAARLILDRGLPVRFLAVGQGPLEDEIAAQHRGLGLGAAFTLLGYRPDALRVMAGCDIFVLASQYEGYPLAVMEAFALGLPVVATAVGGVPEAVRHRIEGLIVPPSDPEALADALQELVSYPDRRRAMGAAAAIRASQYDIRHAIPKIEAIYREVVAYRSRGRGRVGRSRI